MHYHVGNVPWIVSILALALIAWYAARGWRIGAIKAVAWVVGFIVALYGGARFAPSLSAVFGTSLPAAARYGIAFVGIVIIVMIVSDLLAIGLSRFVNLVPLSVANRAAGAAIGVVKGMVFVAVIGAVLALLPLPAEYARLYSRSGVVQISAEAGGYLLGVLEPHVAAPIRTFLDAAREALSEKTQNLPDARRGTSLPQRL